MSASPLGEDGWEHPNFANLPKSLQVIANEAKRNEAIAKYRCCDCFASLRSPRNDKLCFYTFGMLPDGFPLSDDWRPALPT